MLAAGYASQQWLKQSVARNSSSYAFVSDPIDAGQKCYACGWKHNDPGTLASTGSNEGDVIANLDLIDQCKEPVRLWDFAGEYHILFMTAAW